VVEPGLPLTLLTLTKKKKKKTTRGEDFTIPLSIKYYLLK
jgi:hypothetical protein